MEPTQTDFIMNSRYPKKISLMMISLIISLREKKDIAKNIYALRQILYEGVIKKKDNKEISPLKAINLILVSLNNELNTIEHSQDLSNSQRYLTAQDNQGDKIRKYKEFKESYQKNFKSFISDNFLGVLKIERTCSKKHDSYSFKHFYYLSFNCEFLAKYYNKNIILNYMQKTLDFIH